MRNKKKNNYKKSNKKNDANTVKQKTDRTTDNNDDNPWSNLNWKKVDFTTNCKRKDIEMDDTNNNDNDENIGVCMYGLEVLSGDDYNFYNNSISNASTKNDNFENEDKNEDKNHNKNDETKKRKRKKKKKTEQLNQEESKEKESLPETSLEEIEETWSQQSNYTLSLHPTLLQGLQKLNYINPTTIQSKILASGCTYNKANIVAAAPTGSGKTLSFGLPILHNLLNEDTKGIKGLVLAPSRELALQITNELDSVCNHSAKEINIVTIVGGLSQEKQIRLLSQDKKSIVVCTPGRLWELISGGENEMLNDMGNTLEYVVVDEVDRMMMCRDEQIVFPELKNIFDFINKKDEDNEDSDEEERNEEKESDQDENEDKSNKIETKTTKPPEQKFQTFILSATLAMNYKNNPNIKTKKTLKHQNKKQKLISVTQEEEIDFLSRIIDRVGIIGPIQSIDLTTKQENTTGCLPDGIELYELKCIQKHKDSYTYAVLSTLVTKGPTIIFCNSIQCVKRVTSTLSILFNKQSDAIVHALYGNMPQKARLQALESISKNNIHNAILVSTDVASRGIDIPSISTIIHYDVAHTVDTFIHRTGRTARGIIDTSQEYKSISIVAPGKEEKRHEIIVSMLSENNNKFQTIQLNSNILKEVQTRTSLASQIYLLQNEQSKHDMEENYMKRISKEADIDYEDDNDTPKLTKGSKKKIQRLKNELNGRLQYYPLDQDRKSMFGGSFTFGLQNSIRLGLLKK